MNETILLGAGASVEAGIPDAFKMTGEIVRRVNETSFGRSYSNNETREIAKVINFVLGGLLFKLGQANRNPLQEGVNIEDLFNSVLLLSQRDSLEVLPFVESWHSMIETLDSINPPLPDLEKIVISITEAAAEEAEKRIKSALGGYSSSSRLRQDSRDAAGKLKLALEANHPRPGRGHIFSRTATRMLMMLGEMVWVNDAEKIEYLFPLIDVVERRSRLLITTLNYDNTIEFAAASKQQQCNTGIESWSETGVWDFTKEGLHLIKLHGSIDWSSQRHLGNRDRPMPHTMVKKIDDYIPKQNGNMYEAYPPPPAVIFGHRNKLTSDGPFLDLLRQFQSELQKSESLIVIGYSFRDSHVNTYISEWLNESAKNILTIIDPGIRSSNEDYIKELKRINAFGKNRLNIVEKTASEGLKDLYG